MSNEITFDQIKVGDRIKTREVYKNGDTFEGEFTVTEVDAANYIYSEYRVLYRSSSDRESLTIERVQMPEPKKIGTVVEFKRDDVTQTATKFSNYQSVKYLWILSTVRTLTWEEILASDPNPKIKED